MDWSHYSAIGRVTDKVYEESYISSWGISAGSEDQASSLVPQSYESGIEKARIIECANSNKYNITQTIAEQFGVFCIYEYKFDERGKFINEYIDDAGNHWTGRKVIFYNRAIKADNPLVFNYQKNLASFSRTKESSEIYTKMYVTPIESSVIASGIVSIADTPLNPLMDDFILNFDYLYNTGGITQYQYNQVKAYEVNIHTINKDLLELAPQIEDLTLTINDRKAEVALLDKSIQEAEESKTHYDTLRSNPAINQTVVKNKDNPYTVIFAERDNCLTAELRTEGIDKTTIRGYNDTYAEKNEIFRWKDLTVINENAKTLRVTTIKKQLDPGNKAYYLLLDKYGFPCEIYTGLRPDDENRPKIVRVELEYNPANAYEEICNQLEAKINKDIIQKTAIYENINQLNEELEALLQNQKDILQEKEKLTQKLEHLLGPALREGYWNPDSTYDDPGEQIIANLSSKPSKQKLENGAAQLIWDAELFDNEEQGFYYEGGLENDTLNPKKVPYKYINLWADGESGKKYEDILTSNNIKNLMLTCKEVFDPDAEDAPQRDPLPDRTLYYNAGFIIAYLKTVLNNVDSIRPIILFNDNTIDFENYNEIYYSFLISGQESNEENLIKFTNNLKELDPDSDKIVYPRIYIDNINVNYASDLLKLKVINDLNSVPELALTKYDDYSILLRKNKPYITLKVTNVYPINYLMDEVSTTYFKIYYQISRACEMLYLDAKQVAQDYSRPRYSYEVGIANTPDNIAIIDLGQLAYINDHSLGVRSATGYVSSISYNLENPQDDSLIIQNYKTKFEDLFSTITASSEAMKNNSRSYNIAANAFNSSGQLSGDILQNAINSNNISMNFSGTNIEMTSADGIVLTNTVPYLNGVYGQVALRGGGIFLSSAVDSNGGRVWSTGITPTGINASLLTSGKIDTSNIRILSGDNIAFQWNGEGIFAYKYDEEKENSVDLTTYVRFSQHGVQYINSDHTAVDLGWNGLLISTQDGATELTGKYGLIVYDGDKKINADDEPINPAIRIGKFDDNTYGMRLYRNAGGIGEEDNYVETLTTSNQGQLWLKDYIIVGQENNELSSNCAGISGLIENPQNVGSSVRFWAGNDFNQRYSAPFQVLQNGTLIADKAIITGTVYADDGKFTGTIEANEGFIGNWEIKDGSLTTNGIVLQSSSENREAAIIVGDTTSSDNNYVTITGDGKLTANGATINGIINATGGTIGNLTINTIENTIKHETVEITSSNGNITKLNKVFNTILTATIKRGGIALSDEEHMQYNYNWICSADGEEWITLPDSTNERTVNYEEVHNAQLFIKCEVSKKEESNNG